MYQGMTCTRNEIWVLLYHECQAATCDYLTEQSS